jgi:hypothetical protein
MFYYRYGPVPLSRSCKIYLIYVREKLPAYAVNGEGWRVGYDRSALRIA